MDEGVFQLKGSSEPRGWGMPFLFTSIALFLCKLSPPFWPVALGVAAGSFLTIRFAQKGLVWAFAFLIILVIGRYSSLPEPLWCSLFLLSIALSWILSSIDGERQKEQSLLQESYAADLERKVSELEKQLMRSQIEHAEKEALITRLGQSENALLVARAQERDLSTRCEHLQAQLAIESNTSEYEFKYQHAALEEQLQERTQALELAEKMLSEIEDRLTVLQRTTQENELVGACLPIDLTIQLQMLNAQIEQLESHIQELEGFVSLLLPFARTKLC